jgi:LmbE family N-acetylglucosaminyl deacetylase
MLRFTHGSRVAVTAPGATRGLLLASALMAIAGRPAPGQETTGPTVLVVIAHPDDDAMFAGSVYKITHTLHGAVDLALVTDGSGGFHYAQLAEPIYHRKLTDERVARQYLPAIRKRELMAGGAITGVRNYFFLDQFDNAYTENVDTVLQHVWDAAWVRTRLSEIMARGHYDYVFVHLPTLHFHAHHKAATILALEAAGDRPAGDRPVVLGCFVAAKGDTALRSFAQLPGYPITRVRTDVPPFVFDRTEPLSPDGRLDYRIVVNWLIAEHKSQGTMQLLVNRGEIERFWYFAANAPGRLEETRAFFDRLAVPALPASERP